MISTQYYLGVQVVRCTGMTIKFISACLGPSSSTSESPGKQAEGTRWGVCCTSPLMCGHKSMALKGLAEALYRALEGGL